MSASDNVLWKCGTCQDVFYDLQILASHKCMANNTTVALPENCIKELEVQSYDVGDLSEDRSAVQEISNLSIIEGQDVSDMDYTPQFKTSIIPMQKKKEINRRQKGKRSIVWTYFTALDEKKAVCCICHKVISYCGTPTNLVYHLSRYHPNEGDVVKSRQANNVKYQYLTNKLPKPSASAKTKYKPISILPKVANEAISGISVLPSKVNLTEKITEMLLIDMLPIGFLDGEGLKNFLQVFDSSYILPSKREFFVEHIPKKYYVEYKKVQNLLKETDKVHTSVELWTGYNDQKFATVYSHFISQDFEYKHYVLNTTSLSGDITAEHMLTVVLSSVSQWDLSLDVMCIVTDCSDILTKAAKMTGWKPVSCFAHTLDRIINEALLASEELQNLLQKCRQTVTFIRTNEIAKQQLLEIQMQDKQLKMQHSQNQIMDINAGIDKKFPLKMKKDNPDEWISTFYMLQRIATLKNVITKISHHFDASIHVFTREEWIAIEETITLLKSFEVVILELCTEPYQFASKVIPVTVGLMSLITNCNTLKLNCIEKVRKDMLSALRKRLGKVENNLLLGMATVLDPRFKNIAFQSESNAQAVNEAIKSEALKLLEDDSSLLPKQTDGSRDLSSCTDSLWEGFDKKATPKKECLEKNDIVSNELKNYLEEPLQDRKKDPLVWWKTYGQSQFPILVKIVKHVLCIPATSIPPERIFLKKGRIFSERRKLIKPKYIDQFMFLNLNIDRS